MSKTLLGIQKGTGFYWAFFSPSLEERTAMKAEKEVFVYAYLIERYTNDHCHFNQ